jgi:hypothetical protein
VTERTRKMHRVFFWVLVPITLGLLASPWVLPIFYR